MLRAHFYKEAVSAAKITAANAWLSKTLKNKSYDDANGYYTNFDAGNSLGRLLTEYQGLRYSLAYGRANVSIATAFEPIKNAITSGSPVIVGVKIAGGQLVSSGGLAHWAIAVGWDNAAVYLNDPGTSGGNHIRYSYASFDATWATQSRVYAVVSR